MSSQARTVMGALESSLETLRIMKLKMVDTSAPDHATQWGIGSIIATLVARLLTTCNTVIADSFESGSDNTRHDLELIRDEFASFMTEMLGK